ncbi:MAG: tripartite tricarboxylate transporter substrate binding protein, partial [Comamonadaceae bacterium]
GSAALAAPLQNIKAGKLHALAVSSARRHPLLPDVPTLAELGYPDMLDYTWVGMFLPAGTPPAIVARLESALQTVLKAPDMREKLQGQAFEVMADSPAATAEYIKKEVVRWGAVVRKVGVKPE